MAEINARTLMFNLGREDAIDSTTLAKIARYAERKQLAYKLTDEGVLLLDGRGKKIHLRNGVVTLRNALGLHALPERCHANHVLNILDGSDADESEKVRLYNQALLRYNDMTKARAAKPIPVVVEVKKKEAAATTASVVEPADIVGTLPKTLQMKGRQLLSAVTWNERGELIHKGVAIRGSNAVDLVHDLLRNRKTPDPVGWQQFANQMRAANIPMELVGNVTRRLYLQKKRGNYSIGTTGRHRLVTVMERRRSKLHRHYYDPKRVGSYGGVAALRRVVPAERDVERWLSTQDAYTLHKPVRRHFKRRCVVVGGPNQQWQADLVDMSRLKAANDGTTFLLTVIDVFSKRAWCIPLKSKSAASLVAAFRRLLNDVNNNRPTTLQTDKGSEFLNRPLQRLLKEYGVHHFATHNEETKASVVERFNRSLKTRMWRYFTKKQTIRYVDALQDFVRSYNDSYHRSIGMAPSAVNGANQETVWQRLYGHDGGGTPKYRVSDRVRISKAKRHFEKGYMANWTEELFTIVDAHRSDPPVYRLVDWHGDSLDGTFYEPELQKVIVSADKTYRVEAELRRRNNGREVLVKWFGYPESFNSWIDARTLTSYT